MRRKFKVTAKLHIKAGAAEGAAPTFEMMAYGGGAMSVSGFMEPIVVDLAGMAHDETVPMLIDHANEIDAMVGAGRPVKKDGALHLTGTLATGTQADKLIALAKAGVPLQASIGAEFAEADSRLIAAGNDFEANGKTFTAEGGNIRLISKSILREVSFVAAGADHTTAVTIAAAANGSTPMSFEDYVKSLGLDPAALSAEQKDALQKAYDAMQAAQAKAAEEAAKAAAGDGAGDAPEGKSKGKKSKAKDAPAAGEAEAELDPTKMIRATAAAEIERIEQIQAMCKDHPKVLKAAIEQGWTTEKTKIAVLEARLEARPEGGAISIGRTVETNNKVVEAALAQVVKLRNIEKHFDAKTLEAAYRAHRGRISIQRLLIEAAQRNGCAERYLDSGNLRQILKAAWSSNDVSEILSNVLNKVLLETMAEGDEEWRKIAKITSVKDFKTKTSYRLNSSLEYEEVGPGGEITLGTLSEESYTIRAKTYGKRLAITNEDIINDDLGAFDDIKTHLGWGSNMKLNKVFWEAFLDDAAFFSSGNANLVSGGGSALSFGAIKTAITKLRKQKATGGQSLNLRPVMLLVPPELEWQALELIKSTEVRDTTASTKSGTTNVLPKLEVVVVPQLSDTAIAGSSLTAWYVLADPRTAPTMEITFLDGKEVPTIESADVEFDKAGGIQFKGVHYFGAAKLEYRGGVKNAGA